jgi:hypothetical protein
VPTGSLALAGEMVSVHPWTAPAVLIPAPPKTASQTLTALVEALMPPDLDRPAMDGGVIRA